MENVAGVILKCAQEPCRVSLKRDIDCKEWGKLTMWDVHSFVEDLDNPKRLGFVFSSGLTCRILAPTLPPAAQGLKDALLSTHTHFKLGHSPANDKLRLPPNSSALCRSAVNKGIPLNTEVDICPFRVEGSALRGEASFSFLVKLHLSSLRLFSAAHQGAS